MAVKPESSFIARVNDKLPIAVRPRSAKAREASDGRLIHYEKMNNPYSSGTADGWYSAAGGDLWVEFKYLPSIPQRSIVSPTKLLSELQLKWLNGRYEEGRNVAVAIGCPAGGVVLVDRAWEKDLPAEVFKTLMVSVVDLAHWIHDQVL